MHICSDIRSEIEQFPSKKTKPNREENENGAGGGSRTPDQLGVNESLYH